MSIELTLEQNNAYIKLKKALKDTKKRAPIFLYGEKGVGKTTIVNKIKTEYQKSKIINIDQLIRSMLHDDTIEELHESFLLEHSPEEFLDNLIAKNISKDILFLNHLGYLVTNKINLILGKDYNFGKNSDFALNHKLVWIFEKNTFEEYKKQWELMDSPLLNSNLIELPPPNEISLKNFIDLYKISEDINISEEIINLCLRNGYFYYLKRKLKNKLRI